MGTIMTAIGATAIAAILFLLFRVGNLIDLMKGEKPIWETRSNRTNAVMMILFIILFMGGFWWYFFHAQADLLPESASEHGLQTDGLFRIVVAIILIPFVVLNVLLFWAAFRFRYDKNRRSNFHHDNNRLEMTWTIIPGIVFTILILKGVPLWDKITAAAPEAAEVVEIMGFQFGWGVRYPGSDNTLGKHTTQLIDASNQFGMDLADKSSFDDFVTNEIHVPKGKPVSLRIWSRDVIHSVFAPHFRLKQDAVPGMPTSFWFEPRLTTAEMRRKTGKPGFNYEIACAEVCGKGHFAMRMILVVDKPEDYNRWKKQQSAWLRNNPEYLTRVPEHLREAARIKAGLEAPQQISKSGI